MFNRHRYRWTELWLLILPSLFLLLGLFELLLVPNLKVPVSANKLPPLDALTPAFGLIAALFAAHLLLVIIAPDADQTLLPIAGMLTSIGVVMATRLGPDIGQQNLGAKQLVFAIAGLAICVLTVWATRDLSWIRNYKYTWAAVGLVLVAITLVHAHSFSTTAPSRDILTIGSGGLSFQPSEILKICLVIFFAGYLSENREMLAASYLRIGPIRLPPLKHLGPLILMMGLGLLIMIVVKELGLAILIFGLFLVMLYVASDRITYILGSVVAFALGALALFSIFPYAQQRIAVLSTAFEPSVYPTTGYQIVQGLIAFASGGVFGSGLGLGKSWIVPASNTDYISATFGEEFGFAGILALIGLVMLLVYRGMHIATRARSSFNQLLAVGLTAVFALQTIVILAGNLKLLPLTGIPLPFVAYGGSSLIANYIIIGLLLRLSQDKS
jgi:cell division protein FtsW (lipid II flippase)